MRIRPVVLSAIVFVLLAVSQAGAAQITLAWDRNPEPDVVKYVVQYGPASAPFTLSADAGNLTTWTFANAVGGTTYSFRVVAYNTAGEGSDPSATVTATADTTPLPTLAADRTAFNFGIIGGAPQTRTASQEVRLTQTGAGTVTWTATSSASWLRVSPASGSGSGIVTASLVTAASPASGSAGATITIAATGAGNTIAPIAVTVRVIPPSASTAPIGTIDSPLNNVTGVTGSLAITGWAVDDVDITRVRILRDAVGAEPAGQLMFVGDATLVEDARPDIAAAYPTLPRSLRAGWGYLLLTNMLPGLGNGTYRFHAYADDAEGRSTLLGTRTVTCANNSATHPFGAIDTPTPGETVSGNSYVAFGWVLSRGRRADVPGGGTVNVVIDGAVVGTPSGWASRADLTALFPAAQYPGIGSALAAFAFDTTTLANGVHTIAWVVTDNAGNAEGVGSRYFRVFNGAAASSVTASALHAGDDLAAAAVDASAIEVRRGYSPDAPFRRYEAGADGGVTIQSEELDRIELKTNGATAGYLVTHAGLRPLPIGSAFDPSTGGFVWQPGVGFVGGYDLAFVSQRDGRFTRQNVRIVLNAKGSNRVGPQVVVDLAGPVVAGWAADLDSQVGTGIEQIHVWAYPRAGGVQSNPVFVGEASTGGARPDVAAIYGERFLNSGYGLRVRGLAPGTYDLAVFAWSTAKGGWLPAKVATVEVK